MSFNIRYFNTTLTKAELRRFVFSLKDFITEKLAEAHKYFDTSFLITKDNEKVFFFFCRFYLVYKLSLVSLIKHAGHSACRITGQMHK